MATRLTRHLIWTPTDSKPAADAADLFRAAAAPQLVKLATVKAPSVQEQPNLDVFSTPRERAVYLLHIGAEVEHALMAQYLYAAYSLGGPHLTSPEPQRLVQRWRATVLRTSVPRTNLPNERELRKNERNDGYSDA